MPPARPKAVEDSRSETSSTIGNLKDKNIYAVATGPGISKSRRTILASHNGSAKVNLNGAAVPVTSTGEIDPSLPRTDWTTISPATLRTYRTAYRLPTASCYTHPHAELIYQSSRTALHAPSAILARRRLRDLKHQRRKAAVNGISSAHTATKTTIKSKPKDKEKEKDSEKESDSNPNPDHLLKPSAPNYNAPSQSLDGTSDTSPNTSQQLSAPVTTIPPAHIGKQTPMALATAVRKHFNAQQLSEAETVARFVYVVRQTRGRDETRIEGSDGDGSGFWMGSQGREVRRGEGGGVGFRMRFRP